MSEEGEYSIPAQVEVVGYDTLHYSIVRTDTALTLKVRASGYAAFLQSISSQPLRLQLAVADGEGCQAVAIGQLSGEVSRRMSGAQLLDADRDSVRVRLAARASRTYAVQIKNAHFLFADSYGLYGEPRVEPSELTLYGAEEVLSQIDAVGVVDTTIAGIRASGWYTLPVAQRWGSGAEVKTTCSEVRVYVPVEAYVEHQYQVPITVSHADTLTQLRFYPPQVTVRAWVAQHAVHNRPQLKVAVNYADIEQHPDHLTPQLVQFPSYLRLRSIEPAEVQCVIIK